MSKMIKLEQTTNDSKKSDDDDDDDDIDRSMGSPTVLRPFLMRLP